VGIIIAQLGACRRYLRVVVSTLVPKVMEYSSMAAPIYASWGFDTDIYYDKIFDKVLFHKKSGTGGLGGTLQYTKR
jgi:hypothetical protein